VGHCYYFADFIYPVVADLREWRLKRLVYAPWPISALNLHGRDGAENADVRVQWNE
jgi:hypothetical protein